MSQVRINVEIPAGDLEVVIPLHLTISESGTGLLAGALNEAVTRVLRAYGLNEAGRTPRTVSRGTAAI